jgi:catechol 2,3-dioxygenase-like lactoylglutathione lyase family enzyme
VIVQIQFIASTAAIAADPEASRRLYVDALGLPLDHAEDDDYYHSDKIGGSKHFGVWPLTQAAQACFGSTEWPAEHPIPQASIEFEVVDVDAVTTAAKELTDGGFSLLHDARLEPWGQTVARLLSPEGLVVGISFAPSLH